MTSSIHFEFGRHLHAGDAHQRVKPHLGPDVRPDRMLLEYSGPRYESGITEDQFVAAGARGVQTNQRLARGVSEGLVTGRETTDVHPRMSPYKREVVRLLAQANQSSPRKIQIEFEQPPEDALRAIHRRQRAQEEMRARAAVGELDGAFREFRKSVIFHAHACVARENALVKRLEQLRQAHPQERVLVEIGASHAHVVDLLERRGHTVTWRNLLPGRYHNAQRKAQELHGLRDPAGAHAQEASERKEFLATLAEEYARHEPMPHAGSARRAVIRLSRTVLDRVWESLQRTGRPLGPAIHQALVREGFLTPPQMPDKEYPTPRD